jgi:hypothetical protein
LIAALNSTTGEVLAAYQMQALNRRARLAGREPVFSPKSSIARAVCDGWDAAASPIVAMLRKGAPKPGEWKTVLRDLRSRLRRDIVRQKLPGMVSWPDDVVTVATGPMIGLHAAAMGNVTYIPLSTWFHPLRPDDRKTYTGGLRPGLIDTIMDVTAEAFAAGNEPLLGPTSAYLRRRLVELSGLADRYVGRILAKSTRVPRRLWRGTGGLIYSRLLSLASQEAGGHVTGHDHAQGQGLWSSYSDTILELPFADRFMVWTERQKDLAERNFRAEFFPFGPKPSFVAVPRAKSHSEDSNCVGRRLNAAGRQTIMYVGTIYVDDVVHLSPLHPGVTLLDWEMRLVSQLVAYGYDVIMKPHPESQQKVTEPFERLGARFVHDRFEKVLGQADVVLCAQANSTTFYDAIGTDAAIVLPDFPLNPWQPEVRELVERRCAFARTWLDENNRLHTDGDDLRSAIRRASDLRCPDFNRELFGR